MNNHWAHFIHSEILLQVVNWVDRGEVGESDEMNGRFPREPKK